MQTLYLFIPVSDRGNLMTAYNLDFFSVLGTRYRIVSVTELRNNIIHINIIISPFALTKG